MNKLVNVYFRQVKSGALGRLHYLLYFFIVSLVWAAIGATIGVLFGVAEHLIGGDLQEAQAILQERFSGIFITVLAVLVAIVGFAYLNIAAKRVRDIGLPAWTVVIVFLILSGFATAYVTNTTQSGLSTLFFFALLLIPGGVFTRDSGNTTRPEI